MNQTEIISIITKKTLGLTFVLSAAAFAFAQQKLPVSGTIVDNSNQPVPYASVSFSNTTSKLLSDAALTDENGKYTLELAAGTYNVTVEAIDFKKTVSSKQITAPGNIGSFTLEPESTQTNLKTQDIQGIVITATTKPYKVELDKRTYDPSQDIVSRGGSLQDVLANVPSVSVDTDGTVSMRGSSNVRFLINGKPSALLGIDDGANALQSIPADQIERIEVITNPSSKFEASGTAGILNIILKKSKRTGFNGSVIGTVGYLPQTNLNANLSWRKGNLTWFLNGGGGYRESENTNRNNARYFNSAVSSRSAVDQESVIKNSNKNYNASTGLVYDFSEKTSFNISATVRAFESDNTGTITYDERYFSGARSSIERINDGMGENFAIQGDIGLDHKFDDKGQNLALSLSLQSNESDNLTQITENENSLFVLNNIIDQNTKNRTLVGKADYELPIGENARLEAGYRIDINNNLYDNDVLERDLLTVPYTFLPRFTYDADYREVFNAGYIQFKSKIGKLGYQLGLRNEHSNVSIKYANLESGTANIDSEKNYNNLFPSVYLSYELAKDDQFLLNYSRRIDRPRSYFLIPNPSYSDNQNIFAGNIDLNPSYVDSFEFGYSISKPKYTINPTLYYRKTIDDVKIVVYTEDDVFYTKPVNLGADERYGLDMNFNFDATKWLKFLGSVNLFGYRTTGSYYDAAVMQKPISFEGKGFSTIARLTSTFRIDKTFSLQLQGFFRGAQKTENQDRREMYALNLGASKTIWDGNGTITFNIQDIFNTRAMRSVTSTSDFTRESYMQWQPRQFALSLTYRFKQGEKVDQPKRRKDVNSNENGDDQQGPM